VIESGSDNENPGSVNAYRDIHCLGCLKILSTGSFRLCPAIRRLQRPFKRNISQTAHTAASACKEVNGISSFVPITGCHVRLYSILVAFLNLT
jgi:hypothetical protein